MKKFLLFLFFLLCLSIGGWFWYNSSITLPSRMTLSSSVVSVPSPEILNIKNSDLTEEYRNDTYKFSLYLPENFTATEIGTDTVVLQNNKGEGIQIMVSPFDEDMQILTAERIHEDVPDMEIHDVQPVEVGSNYGGVAFKSDNLSFGGASREVWFVFRGNLYQISTYDHLDRLLQTVFSTWKFF